MRIHPLRPRLTQEIHARPPVPLDSPTLVSFLVFMHGETKGDADRPHLDRLGNELGLSLTIDPEDLHLLIDGGAFRLKWEKHMEFSSYAFFAPPQQAYGSGETALSKVPAEWVAEIPGELVVAAHVDLFPADRLDPKNVLAHLADSAETVVATRVANNGAWVFSDFRLHDDFSRFIVIDDGCGRHRAGRTVQRLLEIETYRTVSLLAFPVAREVGRLVERADRELAALIDRMGNAGSAADDRAVLQDLTRLAAEVEHSVANSNRRFSAAAAYYRLVQQRIAELGETKVENNPSLRSFMERRLAPALGTVAAIAHQQEELSARITRTSQLLRTRVDIELEQQNQDLLAQMNRRARLQLRLQETVEGLSIAAITYYASQLVHYLTKGAKEAFGVGISPEIITAVAIPFIALVVAFGTHRVRKRLAEAEESTA
ncbi:MAG: DUF3422 family protein [Betaproteobacteria bacterium]